MACASTTPLCVGLQRSVKKVSFGCVTVAEFSITIDDSKLPSDGLSPLGLGDFLQMSEAQMIDAYEAGRSRCGVRHLDDFERRGLILGRLDEVPDQQIVEALEACEASNRLIRSYQGDDEEDTIGRKGDTLQPYSDSTVFSRVSPMYSTAEHGAKRDGLGGGFHERDKEEEARRKARALAEKAATGSRKAERRRCADCKRFACIC